VTGDLLHKSQQSVFCHTTAVEYISANKEVIP